MPEVGVSHEMWLDHWVLRGATETAISIATTVCSTPEHHKLLAALDVLQVESAKACMHA